MRPILLFTLLHCIALPAIGQQVLQIEKYGSPKTEKIYIGEPITYQLKGDERYITAFLEEVRPEDSLLLLGNRYVYVHEISSLRFDRPWAKAAGVSLFWFGIGWSGFAAVGTALDGDPDTSYRWSDAAVTLTSLGLSFVIPRLFRYKTVRLGERRRLRALDLSFGEPLPGSPPE